MSGGHWDYSGLRLEEMLTAIGRDTIVRERFSLLARVLENLGPVVQKIEHELDWDLSADSRIKNDLEFEVRALTALRNAVDWNWSEG